MKSQVTFVNLGVNIIITSTEWANESEWTLMHGFLISPSEFEHIST